MAKVQMQLELAITRRKFAKPLFYIIGLVALLGLKVPMWLFKAAFRFDVVAK